MNGLIKILRRISRTTALLGPAKLLRTRLVAKLKVMGTSGFAVLGMLLKRSLITKPSTPATMATAASSETLL